MSGMLEFAENEVLEALAMTLSDTPAIPDFTSMGQFWKVQLKEQKTRDRKNG